MNRKLVDNISKSFVNCYILNENATVTINNHRIDAIAIECMDGGVEYITVEKVKGVNYVSIYDRKFRHVLSLAHMHYMGSLEDFIIGVIFTEI